MKYLYTIILITLSLNASADIDIGKDIVDNPAYAIAEIKVSETCRYKITTKINDAQQGIALMYEYSIIAKKRGYKYFTATADKKSQLVTYYMAKPETKEHVFDVAETLKMLKQ
jgi:hypothetical protein